MIRDRRAVLPHCGSDVLLLQLELFGQPSVCERFFDWIEIFSLNVLDQCHFQERALLSRRYVSNDNRHTGETSFERGTPPTLTGNDLKPIANLPDDNRLDDAVRLDGLRQLVESYVVDVGAWLERVWRQAIDVNLGGLRAGLGRIRN